MTKEEYEKKFNRNTRITGYGPNGLTMHMPCPACAEADFMVYKVLNMEEETSKEHVCTHCGHGSLIIYTRKEGGISFEVVQTRGPDLPEFLPPMKRLS